MLLWDTKVRFILIYKKFSVILCYSCAMTCECCYICTITYINVNAESGWKLKIAFSLGFWENFATTPLSIISLFSFSLSWWLCSHHHHRTLLMGLFHHVSYFPSYEYNKNECRVEVIERPDMNLSKFFLFTLTRDFISACIYWGIFSLLCAIASLYIFINPLCTHCCTYCHTLCLNILFVA